MNKKSRRYQKAILVSFISISAVAISGIAYMYGIISQILYYAILGMCDIALIYCIVILPKRSEITIVDTDFINELQNKLSALTHREEDSNELILKEKSDEHE